MTAPDAHPDSVSDPEAWDYLERHRNRKQRCLDDAMQIQASCTRDPGHTKTPVADCKACHRKIIDLISHRYLDAPETEWYAARPTFLHHLAELFPAVRSGEVDASGIEDRVVDEKRKWYRENVRRIGTTLAAAGMPERREELVRLLDDRKLEFSAFCARVHEVLTGGLKTPCPPDSLKRLIAARNDPSAGAEAYKATFFHPHGGREEDMSKSTRKYLEMIEQGMSMTKVSSMMVEDKRQALANRPDLSALEGRIEHLQKAKATWLAQRQRKSRNDGESKKAPPCYQCGSRPEVADPASCAICQLAVAKGIADEPVVYCSEECQRLGHGDHVADAHQCSAGKRCITLSGQDQGGEVGFADPTNAEGDVYLCRECLEQRRVLEVFCSLPCAEANINHHQHDMHPFSYRSKSAAPAPAAVKDTAAHLITLERALQQLLDDQLVDQLSFVPKLAPTAKAPKGELRDHHTEVLAPDGHHKAEEHNNDEMDVDAPSAGVVGPEPMISTQHSPGRRHHDDSASGDTEMKDVQQQHSRGSAPGPHDSAADTEMMYTVAVADFAERPEAAEPDTAASAPAASGTGWEVPPDEAKAAESPTTHSEPPKEMISESQPAPSSGKTASPRPSEHPVPSLSSLSQGPEPLPISSPGAASEARKPSSTTISSPDRITSIEPMPSLGRSLEVAIAKIPLGGEVRSDLDEPALPEAELAARRDADVDTMDIIADNKAASAAEKLHAQAVARRKASVDGGQVVQEGVKRAEAKEGSGSSALSAEKGAEAGQSSGEATDMPSAADEKALNMPAEKKAETATTNAAPKQSTEHDGADVSQKSGDSMEEGEILEGVSKKRKASLSVEPGEVQEHGGEHSSERQPKKARSVHEERE